MKRDENTFVIKSSNPQPAGPRPIPVHSVLSHMERLNKKYYITYYSLKEEV